MEQPIEVLTTTYSAYHFWDLAAAAAQRSRDTRLVSPENITTDTVTALLLAAMSAEAFINELGTRLSLIGIHHQDQASQKWVSIGNLIEQMEKEKVQVKSKYLWVSHVLPGEPLMEDRQPFQDFSRLMRIRNDFAHPKAQQDSPKYLQYFRQKGWLFHNPNLVGWMNQLQTPEIAIWACKAARDIAWNIVSRFESVDHLMVKAWYQADIFHWGKSLNDSRLK